jgi:hypothetical protein
MKASQIAILAFAGLGASQSINGLLGGLGGLVSNVFGTAAEAVLGCPGAGGLNQTSLLATVEQIVGFCNATTSAAASASGSGAFGLGLHLRSSPKLLAKGVVANANEARAVTLSIPSPLELLGLDQLATYCLCVSNSANNATTAALSSLPSVFVSPVAPILQSLLGLVFNATNITAANLAGNLTNALNTLNPSALAQNLTTPLLGQLPSTITTLLTSSVLQTALSIALGQTLPAFLSSLVPILTSNINATASAAAITALANGQIHI